MVLWILATPDTFRSVALRFGVYPSEVHDYYKLIIVALREMGPRFVKWPKAAERHTIKTQLERVSDFPGIIGIMDGSHFEISGPVEDKAAYRNRHHGFSIQAQVVCDHRLLVTDLNVGEAGSLHDARVFRRSPLCRNMLERPDMFSEGEHIIAGSAYMLLDKVITPFENDGHLQPPQSNYNRRLSKVRARVEHTFGKTKGIWRRTHFLHVRNMEYAVDHIIASFVLHNYRILHGQEIRIDHAVIQLLDADGAVDGPEPGMDDVLHDPHVPQGDFREVLADAHGLGVQKRWDICNTLPPAEE